MNIEMHAAWLSLDTPMSAAHGEHWSLVRQGMQISFYLGAMVALCGDKPRDQLLREAQAGLDDALGNKGAPL